MRYSHSLRWLLVAAGAAAALSLQACNNGGQGYESSDGNTGALQFSAPEEVEADVCYDPAAPFPQQVDAGTFTLTINPLLLIGVPAPLTLTGDFERDPGTEILWEGTPVADVLLGEDVVESPPRETIAIRVTHDMGAAGADPVEVFMSFGLWDADSNLVDFVETTLTLRPSPCPNPQGSIVFSNAPPIGALERDAEIWKVDFATGNATQLTSNQQIADMNPAWSGDRSQIVFVSNRVDSARINFDLVVMDADGSQQQAVTDFDAQGKSANDPSWSPVVAGNRIAFTLETTGNGHQDIWILDLDETVSSPDRLRQLTSGGNGDTSPRWSADGTEIAFARGGSIHVVPADGPAAPAMRYSAEYVYALDWGSEGFAFQAYNFTSNDQRLARIDSLGAGFLGLTTDATDTTPAWSPTSDYVVFVRPDEENGDRLRTVDADGAQDLGVSGQPNGANRDPDW